jgi:hypothetical protein
MDQMHTKTGDRQGVEAARWSSQARQLQDLTLRATKDTRALKEVQQSSRLKPKASSPRAR